jgi:transposase
MAKIITIPGTSFPGIPPEILAYFGELYQQTASQVQLEGQSIQSFSTRSKIAGKENNEETNLEWQFKYGGMKVPHLHINGEIYLMDKKQWNEFSGKIIKEFSKKLAEAKSVNFRQLTELSDAMSEIL